MFALREGGGGGGVELRMLMSSVVWLLVLSRGNDKSRGNDEYSSFPRDQKNHVQIVVFLLSARDR